MTAKRTSRRAPSPLAWAALGLLAGLGCRPKEPLFPPQPKSVPVASAPASIPASAPAPAPAAPQVAMRIEGRQVFAPEFLHVGLEFAFLARAQTLPEDPVLVFLAASCVGYNEGAPVERLIGCIFARDLLIEEARRRGLAVSDAEVSEELAKPKLPVRTFLQKDGVIDAEALRRYASSLGISETETRELVRRSVLARKAAEAIAEKASVSDEQAKAEYERQNTQVALELIEVPILPWVAKVTLSPEEIAKFAASNTDLVQAVFEERQMGQDAVRARHILIKCPKGAPPKEEEEAKAEAEAVYKRAQAGEDFAGLANETSDDRGSATNGGELGWFGRGMMVKEFEVQAFLRQPGEISPPFRSPFGYHILQVEEKRGALSLEQAAPKIAEEFAREDAAIAAAKKQAAELLAKAKKTPKNPFAKLLPKPEKDGPAVRDLAKTSLAALPEALTALKLAPDPLLLEAIAKLSPKDSFAPDAYLSGTSLVLVRLKEQSLPDPKGFTAQAEELKKTQLPKAKFDTLTAWLQSNATVAQSTVEPDPKVVLPLLELLGIQ